MSDFQASGFCHRCGGELPPQTLTGEPGLFCPDCGAPQLLLPEYMHPEPVANPIGVPSTTGAVPPPPLQLIDWRNALVCCGAVAALAALLTAIGVLSSFASLLNFVWVVSGGVMAVTLYGKRRAATLMNGRVGARIGLVAGLMVLAAMAIALASAGVIARFGLHHMESFDAQVVESSKIMQAQMQASLEEQKQSREVQDEVQARILGMANSPEIRAGVAVVYLGLLGTVVVLLGMAGGAFAGMLMARRQGVQGLL